MTGNVVQHCETCEHWETNGAEWGLCALAGSLEGEREHENALAFAQDGERQCAWLRTHATFGCVQWAAKKVKEGEDV